MSDLTGVTLPTIMPAQYTSLQKKNRSITNKKRKKKHIPWLEVAKIPNN